MKKKNTIPLESDRYYHIFNRGINGCEVFRNERDYLKFIELIHKHLLGHYTFYSWVLIPNHFHFLIFIPESDKEFYHQPISNLCNAYAQFYNKKYERHGGLFERPFRRKLLDSDEYLREVVKYIHYNPRNHLLCDHILEYPWSSYGEIIGIDRVLPIVSPESSKELIDWFGDKENFMFILGA